MDRLAFIIDDQPVELRGIAPTITLLQWLRSSGRTGTKEGCAEGDCGACTVLILDQRKPAQPRLRAVSSCLVLLPMIHEQRVWTVAGLAASGGLHVVQDAMVRTNGSQCGYCTPGFIMSMAEAAHRPELAGVNDGDWRLDDQLCGNLCRCTGYRPIRDALKEVAGTCPPDGLSPHLSPQVGPADATHSPQTALDYQVGGQRFMAPTTLAQAVEALARQPDARVVCGSTDLGLDVTQRHREFPVLVSLAQIPQLQTLQISPATDTDPATALIGAAVPLTDLEAWSATALPVLHRMLRYFGSRQIKHQATIGGNLCNASPIGDLAPVLLALDAGLRLDSAEGSRWLPVANFFLGYRKTALQPGELLAQVRIPLPTAHTRVGAYKVSRRRELDISTVSASFAVDVRDDIVVRARLAFGGMAATPARARQAEAALVGQPWTPASIAAAQTALDRDFQPIGDHRASAWYRRTVARNLLPGFFEETRQQASVALHEGHCGTVMLSPRTDDGGAA